MSGGLYGKTALVVNGTDTIGKAISRRLGLAGAKIFLTGSSQQTLEQTVSDLGDKGVIACGAVFDPSIESHRKQLVEEIQNKYKGLDCVVLNPGRNEVTGDIINSSKLQFDQVFSQYLTIPFLLASSAYPLLQKSKNGSVIFLSSMAGYTSFIDLGLYSTVQTAVLGLTKALAVDMAKENVRVNSVVLGMFKDDETGSVWNTDDETAKNSLENLIPLGRLAQPKDCAGLIEFLVSDRARYISAGALQPNSKLVITDKASTLFIHFKSDKERLWDGDSPDVDTLKKMSGLDDVLPLTELPRFLITNLQPSNSFAFDDRGLDEDESVVKLRSGFRGKRLVLLNEIDHLRWRKSPAEIEHLRTAARIGSEAHNAMLETQKNVNQESHIVGFLEYEMRRRGANCQAYSPVVAAGKRANTIHYIDSNKTIHNDDCVLVDAGADYHGYVSDITRCFPVSGTFTPAQRELYEALSEVHEECLEYAQNVRPLKLSGLYLHMLGAMATILKSMFFFKKGISDEEIIEACYKLCEHHVSHYLGMDVHDTPTVSRSIEMPPGVVFTIEPGIYVDRKMTETLINPQFADIGFRIEDDVLLTDTGIEILSKRAVRNGDDIEKLMKWSY
ncbi:unnamed protein product [Bursaphelenchus xylophilus]|uniref:(pine wood nematode) hypothetical protein n=1 Tax=Bursaphelenchus xylophilus TaxID=6326 RepID=A0A811K110_BURXY|nr:unnamed protein product [Bursaphelenchus xylophilus]CAG9084279.1 unnamed protein product [Bursaphelenchus xylophilus]